MTSYGLNRSNYSLSQTKDIAKNWKRNAGVHKDKDLTKADLEKAQGRLNKKGVNSKALNDTRASFDILDKNRDGKLNTSEIQGGLNLNAQDQKNRPIQYSKPGQISLAKHRKTIAEAENKAYGAGKLKQGGQNKKGDGKLSFDEAEKWFKGSKEAGFSRSMFNQMDVTGDGFVGQYEYKRLTDLHLSKVFNA
ncbi:hypothetical protein [Vampirovibrio sp.]|uniref:hypothetical protein n=1 Tax=Vampirovibrio sp. TaxID=2717857 RepID=UPI00359463CF